MAKARFKIEWYADEVMKAVSSMTRLEERATARRILKRARRYVPVGGKMNVKLQRRVWKSKHPGSLKRSLKIRRSKFQKGGYVVTAGGDIDHAVYVEYGTIFTDNRKGFRFMKKALALEQSRFTRQLRKGLGV